MGDTTINTKGYKKMYNSPCHECICVPICRYKQTSELYLECRIVLDYLYEGIIDKGTATPHCYNSYKTRMDVINEDLDRHV